VRQAVLITSVAAGVAALPSSAVAQDPPAENASGSIVQVTGGGETTSVGETTATVTTGTSSDPASGEVTVIEETTESAGEAASDVATPTAQTDGKQSTSTATVTGTEGVTATSPAATTSAETVANVDIGTGRVVAGSGRRTVEVRIRGGRSRSIARRRGRKMQTSASSAVGNGRTGNGLSVEGLVTVGELRAETTSTSGTRVRSRRTLRIRDLRVRGAAGGQAVIHVRWARMLRGGRLEARITLRPSSGSSVTRTIVIRRSRRGRDLLTRSTYRGTSLAEAFRALETGRLEDVENRLRRVRVGGSRSTREGKRTTSSVTGLTVELVVAGARTGAGTSQLGIVSAVAGAVSSAATAAATPIVSLAQETAALSATIAEAAAEVPGAISDLQAILGGESFTIRNRVEKFVDRRITLVITCAADFAGDLFLFDPEDQTRLARSPARLTCSEGLRQPLTLVLSQRAAALLDEPEGLEVLPQVDLDGTLTWLTLEPLRLIEPE
jgi:hypothetical protein